MNIILFFASDFKIGLSSLLTDQLIALFKRGLNIVAIAGDNEQEKGLSQLIADNSISIIRINGLDEHHGFKQLSMKIAEIIRKYNVQIIHVQNNWQLALVSYAKYVLCNDRLIKVVYTLHGFRHNNPLKAFVARIIIGIALFCLVDRVICMSQFLKSKFFFLSYKIELLPLGISDSYFTNQHNIHIDNGLQMIFPAEFRKGKNQKKLLYAFARHIKSTNDMQSHLILPGSGVLLKDMMSLSDKLGISNRVSFPGQCTKEKIKELYLNCNIGLVSSNSETYGQSIVEPFVLGRCVISTSVGIAPDIILQGENGFIYKNEDELVSIMKRLYYDPSLMLKCGKRAYNNSKMFKWEEICMQYKSMIDKL